VPGDPVVDVNSPEGIADAREGSCTKQSSGRVQKNAVEKVEEGLFQGYNYKVIEIALSRVEKLLMFLFEYQMIEIGGAS